MRAKLANLNDCAVLFLNRADANMRWYYYDILKRVMTARGGRVEG